MKLISIKEDLLVFGWQVEGKLKFNYTCVQTQATKGQSESVKVFARTFPQTQHTN